MKQIKNSLQSLGLLLTLSLLALGCNARVAPAPPPATPNGNGASTKTLTYPLNIVTTCAMVTDIVTIVAGDKAEVTGLIGEGIDPHLYQPTRNDVVQLLDADVVFYSGLMLEGGMTDKFSQVARKGVQVYAVTESLDEKFLRKPEEFEGHFDPHVWMDVTAWAEAVTMVATALGEFDTANKSYYEDNANKYREQLTALDEYAKKVVGSVPKEQRVLITAHDAFGYFARAYDVPVRSVQGLSTESEAGINDINELVDFIVEKKVKAIFVESSVSQENIKAVIENCAKRDWTVVIGGELYSDAMGAPGTYEGTYIGMIDHNATTVARALGGEAPELGFQGKLSKQEEAKAE